MKTEDKPRIARVTCTWFGGTFVAWRCIDARHVAIGASPVDAFETWQRVRDSAAL